MSVYIWGLNEDGQCADENEASLSWPKLVDFKITVKSLSLGSRHTLFSSKEGLVYSFGWGAKGQLGLGHFDTIFCPEVIEFLRDWKITEVAAGGYHSLVLTEKGNLFTFGGGSYGQLAQGGKVLEDSHTPLKISLKDTIITQIAAGGAHSMAISKEGNLYAWGRSIDGQLGLGIMNEIEGNGGASPTPLVLDIKNVVNVSCGSFHSAAVTSDGSLYTWGKEDYGVLGQGASPDIHVPKKIDALIGVKIEKVSCGGWHTLALDNHGNCYAFGRGEYGRLGLGDDISRRVPTKIDMLDGNKVKDCSAGGTHSLFLCEDGRVTACGRGVYGRLGLGDTRTSTSPNYVVDKSHNAVRNAIMVSAGGTHSGCLILKD